MNVYGATVRPGGAACNLVCDYCYYLSDESRARGQANLQFMRQRVLSPLLTQLLSMETPYLSFHWEGGEPLLAGVDFYEEVFAQQRHIAPSKRIRNRLQTNGLLLNEEWIALFKRHADKVSVGLSLDGPREINDAHRIHPSRNGTFSQVMRAVRLLQGNNIRFSVSAVVTKTSLGRAIEIYEFFVSNDIGLFNFYPFVAHDKQTFELDPASLTPKEYAGFLIALFDHWIAAGKSRPHIGCLVDLTRVAFGKMPRGCTYRPQCGSFLGVDYNGDVYPCAYFIGVKEWKLGNLLETDLRMIGQSEIYRRFLRETRELDKCQACQWLAQCNRGCSYQRYQQSGSFANKTYFCGTTKALLEHISRSLRR